MCLRYVTSSPLEYRRPEALPLLHNTSFLPFSLSYSSSYILHYLLSYCTPALLQLANYHTLLTAKQATCSCGEQSALHCSCNKASLENTLGGPRCSCRARPAGQCTCDRSPSENATPTGSTCSCGARPSGEVFGSP